MLWVGFEILLQNKSRKLSKQYRDERTKRQKGGGRELRVGFESRVEGEQERED